VANNTLYLSPLLSLIIAYNMTGKCLLVLFVGMAHFLGTVRFRCKANGIVVTILVSVLSNTFSDVSKNAREGTYH